MKAKSLILSLFFVLSVLFVKSQNAPATFERTDSLYFSKPYPYVLPILGDKAHNAKVRIPMSVGNMFNTLEGYQGFALNNMLVGVQWQINYRWQFQQKHISWKSHHIAKLSLWY